MNSAFIRRREHGEHAEHLAEIAREAQNVTAVVGEARPLRLVLDRRVPQERVANGRVGRC